MFTTLSTKGEKHRYLAFKSHFNYNLTMPLTFLTGNANKAAQLSQYLELPVDHHKLDLHEIQSLDNAQIAEHKTHQAYHILHTPVLTDDVSLVIHSLGRLPGPFVKFFIDEIGNQGICNLITSDHRSATASVTIGYYDGHDFHTFVGTINGTISSEPRGDGGFGWDAIFIPTGYTQTRAEMNQTDYDATSPRKAALLQLRELLSAQS